jgi:glycosyltransferase involved in cell wall biosynthesis
MTLRLRIDDEVITPRSPAVTVILSTYNSPGSLEKVLHGYALQTFRDFEIIIADDGSTQDTALTIERLRKYLSIDLLHVWQPDEGFRKTRILNRAISAARGNYLVFSDGDCIPRQDFIETHVKYSEANRFLSGGCLRLPLALSERLSVNDVTNGRVFSLKWLIRQGVRPNYRFAAFAAPASINMLLNQLTTTKPSWNGHNASAWRSDLIKVNGFDERMRYGGEDRELGERLANMKLRPRQIRFFAICLHLEHGRSYVSREDWARNNLIRRETRRTLVTWTNYGIQQQIAAGPTIVRQAA